MRMFKKEEGFTLVELMVVVLIIGILVAIAIPVFNAASDSARERTCFANQRTLEGAAQQWVASGTITTPNLITTLDSPATLVPLYVAELPACPSGGTYSMADGVVADCTMPLADPHGHY